MSSLVTDNSKKQKKDNTEEKNFPLNKLPEVMQKYISEMVEHSEPLFKIEFQFKTSNEAINTFYQKAEVMVQAREDWDNSSHNYYRNFADERLSEYETEDNLVQCPMLENLFISIIPKSTFIPGEDERYNQLSRYIQNRLRSTDDHMHYSRLPAFNVTFGNREVYSLISQVNNTALSRPKSYFLDLNWIHDDGPIRDDTINYVMNEDANDEISQEFYDWINTYTDDANETDKIVDDLSDMDDLSVYKPQQWDIVLRHNILQPTGNEAIQNRTLQAVLHDLRDDDEYDDEYGGRRGMNTKNWKITKGYRFIELLQDIKRTILQIFKEPTRDIKIEEEGKGFNEPLTFNNGNIGSENRPLTYTLKVIGSRKKISLNKKMQKIGVKFYKDNSQLKF